MKQKWIVLIILLVIVLMVTIYSLFPLPDDLALTNILIAVPVFLLLIISFVLGIAKEMKAVFGSSWKRPFATFMGGFYIVVGLLPQFLTLAFQIKLPWSYPLWFFLSLPICYFSLVLYRKFLLKNKGVSSNE